LKVTPEFAPGNAAENMTTAQHAAKSFESRINSLLRSKMDRNLLIESLIQSDMGRKQTSPTHASATPGCARVARRAGKLKLEL
jgi:hypothetical protein